MSLLTRSNGPECPSCGCADCRILREAKPGAWFQAAGQARCNHCRRVFSISREIVESHQPREESRESRGDVVPAINAPAPLEQAIMYVPIRCPACASKEVRVTSKQGRIRYHKCACGHKFKSIEGD